MRAILYLGLFALLLAPSMGCGSRPTESPLPEPKGTEPHEGKNGPAAATTPGATQSAPANIEGEYILVGREIGGKKKIPEAIEDETEAQRTVKIGKDTIEFTALGIEPKPMTAAYKLDPAKSPAEIDVWAVGGDRSLGIYGIYKWEDDTLTIFIIGSRESGQRPKEFKTAAPKDGNAKLSEVKDHFVQVILTLKKKTAGTMANVKKKRWRMDSYGHLAVSPVGSWAAALGGGHDDDFNFGPKVIVWKVGEREATERLLPQDLVDPTSIAFSVDGKKLACASDLKVFVWNVQDGSVVSVAKLPESKASLVCHGQIGFTRDGQSLIIPARDEIIKVRVADGNVSIRSLKDKPEGGFDSLYNPALNRVVEVKSEENTPLLTLRDPGSDGAATSVKLTGGATGASVNAFALSGDGKTIAVCCGQYSDDAKYRTSLHATADGKLIRLLPEDEAANFTKYSRLLLSENGEFLAGLARGSSNKKYESLDVFRVSDGKRLSQIQEPETLIVALAFTADGKSLLHYPISTNGKSRQALLRMDVGSGKQTKE